MDTRTCPRCGTVFEPPREHARFCSARCRVAWNRDHLSRGRWSAGDGRRDNPEDPEPQASALEWAVLGMRDTTGRLGRVRPLDTEQAFAVIGEAVWWVTIVDATMIRYHPQVYETALASLPAPVRQRTEGAFGGLRFVRNRMGYHADHADFIQPEPGPAVPGAVPSAVSGGGAGGGPITAWLWKPIPQPTLDSLRPRSRGWEMSRYRAYQRWLAGQTIGRIFDRTAGFLTLAADLAGGPPGSARNIVVV
ncbi:MAG: hypothetical protein J2P26_03370 [Nocardiopsaceae bacterium]|nr:hypothetical protein [Nocardiopsaceae bacterium]